MTYKLIASWTFIVVLLALLDGVAQQSPEAGRPQSAADVINEGFAGEQVTLDEPTIGDAGDGGIVGTSLQLGGIAVDWAPTFVGALTFDHSFFKGDLNWVRTLLLAYSSAVAVVIAIEFMRMFAGSVRGLFGR